MVLSRLDAIMTSIIDGLFLEYDRMNFKESEENDITVIQATIGSSPNLEHHKLKKNDFNCHNRKGGRIHIESVKRFKSLLPSATKNLLNDCLNIFKTHFEDYYHILREELTVGNVETK